MADPRIQALNKTQQFHLRTIISYGIEDIERLEPEAAIKALNAILSPHISNSDKAMFQKQDVYTTIEKIREILAHPCPQNRTENYPYFDAPKDPNFIVFKDARGVAEIERKGLLSLTAKNDNETRVTKEAVVQFIKNLIQEAIEHQEKLKLEKQKNISTPATLKQERVSPYWLEGKISSGVTYPCLNGKHIIRIDLRDYEDGTVGFIVCAGHYGEWAHGVRHPIYNVQDNQQLVQALHNQGINDNTAHADRFPDTHTNSHSALNCEFEWRGDDIVSNIDPILNAIESIEGAHSLDAIRDKIKTSYGQLITSSLQYNNLTIQSQQTQPQPAQPMGLDPNQAIPATGLGQGLSLFQQPQQQHEEWSVVNHWDALPRKRQYTNNNPNCIEMIELSANANNTCSITLYAVHARGPYGQINQGDVSRIQQLIQALQARNMSVLDDYVHVFPYVLQDNRGFCECFVFCSPISEFNQALPEILNCVADLEGQQSINVIRAEIINSFQQLAPAPGPGTL